MSAECHEPTCGYQEPHRHGFACGGRCAGCRSRDERVEEWYQQSAREMAEEIVDLEDEIAELKHRLEGLEK